MIFPKNSLMPHLLKELATKKCLRDIDTKEHSYSAIYSKIREMEKEGYLISEKKGRIRYITLTEKGKKLIKAFMELQTFMY